MPSRFNGRSTEAIKLSSSSHGCSRTTQLTSAFSAIHADSFCSPPTKAAAGCRARRRAGNQASWSSPPRSRCSAYVSARAGSGSAAGIGHVARGEEDCLGADRPGSSGGTWLPPPAWLLICGPTLPRYAYVLLRSFASKTSAFCLCSACGAERCTGQLAAGSGLAEHSLGHHHQWDYPLPGGSPFGGSLVWPYR